MSMREMNARERDTDVVGSWCTLEEGVRMQTQAHVRVQTYCSLIVTYNAPPQPIRHSMDNAAADLHALAQHSPKTVLATTNTHTPPSSLPHIHAHRSVPTYTPTVTPTKSDSYQDPHSARPTPAHSHTHQALICLYAPRRSFVSTCPSSLPLTKRCFASMCPSSKCDKKSAPTKRITKHLPSPTQRCTSHSPQHRQQREAPPLLSSSVGSHTHRARPQQQAPVDTA